MRGHVDFDEYADDYDRTLNRGLAFSGEDKNFFARARVAWLKRVLASLGAQPRRAIDFGCGTGSSVPLLLDMLGLDSVLGLDVSERSVELAERRHAAARASFATFDRFTPKSDIDLAFCNGVFHHIPPAERAAAVKQVWRALAPGGLWAFWENNPYNPGTQWLMHKLPFDQGVIKISALGARKLLRAGGFDIVRTDHLFLFPKALRVLRPLEDRLVGLPLGAQYLVIARKGASAPD